MVTENNRNGNYSFFSQILISLPLFFFFLFSNFSFSFLFSPILSNSVREPKLIQLWRRRQGPGSSLSDQRHHRTCASDPGIDARILHRRHPQFVSLLRTGCASGSSITISELHGSHAEVPATCPQCGEVFWCGGRRLGAAAAAAGGGSGCLMGATTKKRSPTFQTPCNIMEDLQMSKLTYLGH